MSVGAVFLYRSLQETIQALVHFPLLSQANVLLCFYMWFECPPNPNVKDYKKNSKSKSKSKCAKSKCKRLNKKLRGSKSKCAKSKCKRLKIKTPGPGAKCKRKKKKSQPRVPNA